MLLPVVAREMGVQARRKGMYRLRLGAAFIALGLVGWLVILSSANIPTVAQGEAIFTVLTTVSFCFCVLIGIRATSDCLSEEKREGTLGLLFLTDLRSHSVVLGKVAAGSLTSLLALLAIVPVLTLALLLGGVTLAQVGLTALMLLSTMTLSLSAGAFVSALSRNERSAMLGTFVLIAVIVFSPFVWSWIIEDAQFSYVIIWPSPIFLFNFVTGSNFPGGYGHLVLSSLTFQLVLSGMLLGAAAALVRRTVHSEPRPRWQRVQEMVKRHIYGSRPARLRYRARLLDRNAFLWLAARERIKPRYAWAVLLLLALGWTLMYVSYPRMVFDLPVALLFLFFTFAVFKLWTASEVCSRLIEDRRSGALELLLSTPLSVKEIAQGQTQALRHIFLWPVVVLLVMAWLLARGSLNIGQSGMDSWEIAAPFVAGSSIFLLDLWAIHWLGMWQSLFATSIERVLLGTLFRLLALPWVVFGAVASIWFIFDRLRAASLEWIDLILTWWGLSAFVGVVLGWTARASFLRHFRSVAAQRFEAGNKAAGAVEVWLRDVIQRHRVTMQIVRHVPAPLRRHWILSGATCSILLLTGLALGRQWFWEARVNRELAAIEAAGYPTTRAQLGGFVPPPVVEENAATSLGQAGFPAAINFNLPIGDRTGEEDELRQKRAQHMTQVRALLAVTNYSGWHLEFQAWPWGNSSFGYYQYARLGLLDMSLNIHDRDYPQAATMARSMIHLAGLLRKNPTPESQLAAEWFLQHAFDGLQSLLKGAALPEAVWADLDRRVAEILEHDLLERALAYQRAQTIIELEEGVPFAPPALTILAAAGDAAGGGTRRLLVYLQTVRSAMELADLPIEKRQAAFLAARERFEAPPPSRVAMMFGQGAATPAVVLDRDLRFHLRARMMRIGLALSAYHEREGTYPAKLEQLVPGLLPRIPPEPYHGEPFGYSGGEMCHLFMRTNLPGGFQPVFYLTAPTEDFLNSRN